MSAVERELLELINLSDTPLYSAYRWLEKRLGADIALAEFLRLVEQMIERGILELWQVDLDTYERSLVAVLPRGLDEQYASIPDLHESYDPFCFTLALGPAADLTEDPGWEVDVDFPARRFVISGKVALIADAYEQLSRLYRDVRFIEERRTVDGARVRIEGRIAET